jgi:F-type H+-transporting ATPase subunit delta
VQSQTLARRYATAVFTLARDAAAIDRVGADLAGEVETIYGNDDVRRFYLSPVFERARKEALLLAAFDGKVHEIALHTLLLLVRKRREALLRAISTEYEKLALAAAGKETLEIVSARPLDAKAVAAIVARLEAVYGTVFAAVQRTDPALLGGLRLTMGDRQIDGSLAGRLDELAQNLYAPPTNG